MNEKSNNSRKFIFCIILFSVGLLTGYSLGSGIRSAQATRLIAEYTANARERDERIDRITENNRQLRDGAIRAQAELDAATARVNELENHLRSAGIRNQQVITHLGGARQDIAEASRIIERYLTQESEYENSFRCGDSGSSCGRCGDSVDVE